MYNMGKEVCSRSDDQKPQFIIAPYSYEYTEQCIIFFIK